MNSDKPFSNERRRHWRGLLTASVALVLLAGCQTQSVETVVEPIELRLHGPEGTPIANARVSLNGKDLVSDAAGHTSLREAFLGPDVAMVEAEGFVPAAVRVDRGIIDATMLPLGKPYPFSADSDANVVLDNRARITIEAQSIVDADGNMIHGPMAATIVAMDPLGFDASLVPPQRAIDSETGEWYSFESVVMADISLWQGGRRAQIATGKTATIELVLPDEAQSGYEEGQVIDGYWFDLNAAVWRKEGQGIILPSTLVPGKKAWVAAVRHFTYWSPGTTGPSTTIAKNCVNVLATDPSGATKIGGVRITVTGINYSHGGPASFTNSTVGLDLGRACLEFKPNSQIKLNAVHPSGYMVVNDPDTYLQGNNVNRSCNNGLSFWGSTCSFQVNLKLTLCGNSLVQPGEECDDGNTNNTTDNCTQLCKLPFCGDTYAQASNNEQCDDGNQSNNDTCVQGCKLAKCGDTYLQTGVEECDDGNVINTDACTGICKNAKCGDGFAWANFEQCDDGNAINTDACVQGCMNAKCGDSFTWAGVEQCDDGNQINTDACVQGCKLATCGDTFIRVGVEDCDDGNVINTDACTGICKNAKCGDGFTWMGVEQCDDGNAINTDACVQGCMNAKCGDSFIWAGVEQCDDGNGINTDACVQGCINAKCGDSFIWMGVEQCDDGNAINTDGCVQGCMTATCGDGYVRTGVEQCDDGNASNTDGCVQGCMTATCGDGYVRTGVELCDDGNMSNTDACVQGCIPASCGDGYVQMGVEQCDDGNANNTDACVQGCKTATCGDGYWQTGVEECDDGNMNNDDACVANCKNATCGDGFVGPGEACDDGNQIPGDGCTNCQLPPSTPIWTLSVNGPASSADRGNAIASDAAGNVLVTGYETGAGQGFNIAVRKYTPANGLIWSVPYNDAANLDDIGYGITAAANGDVIVAGAETVSGQGFNGWIRRHAATNGATLWTASYNNAANNSDDFGYSVTTDAAGNVFVAGTETIGIQSNLWIRKLAAATGATVWTKNLTSTAGYSVGNCTAQIDSGGNLVVTAYESDDSGMALNDKLAYYRYANDAPGTLLSSNKWNGAYYAQATAIDSAGNVLVTGYQNNGGQNDIWIAKYTTAGAVIFSSTYAGAAGLSDHGLNIAADSNNNILVAGYETTTAQGANIWVRKLAPNGVIGWTTSYNAIANTNDFAYGIAADPMGNVLVSGVESVAGQSTNIWIRKYSP